MKKITIIFVIMSSFINAELILDNEMILDSVVNAVKSIGNQDSKKQNDNCIKEYKKLKTRHSSQLEEEKRINTKLRYLADTNQIKYEEIDKSTNLKVRYNQSCSVQYYDYFKLSSKQISDLKKENTLIKRVLTKRNIFYQPILNTSTLLEADNSIERKNAKEKMKMNMQVTESGTFSLEEAKNSVK